MYNSFEQIRKAVLRLIKRYNTRDPFLIADYSDIVVIQGNLDDIFGFYKYLQRNKVIFINKRLPAHIKKVVCAHELGHAILHPRQNCFFIKQYTLFSIDRMEIEANKFASELLIDEVDICPDWTTDEISTALNVPKQLVEYKFMSSGLYKYPYSEHIFVTNDIIFDLK